jgi:serine protease Do
MLQHVYQRFRGGCMMLFNREGDEMAFLGTAFLVHEAGYLLTAAHLVQQQRELFVEPFTLSAQEFVPLDLETVQPIGVSVAHADHARDIALLKIGEDLDISVPDHILGRAEDVQIGSNLACLGYPFGYHGLHNQVILQAVLASKIISRKGTRLLIFDSMVHNGTCGGPLISLQDGRVIGVVSGRFHPSFVTGGAAWESSDAASLSFAVAVEYAVEVLEAQGVQIV